MNALFSLSRSSLMFCRAGPTPQTKGRRLDHRKARQGQPLQRQRGYKDADDENRDYVMWCPIPRQDRSSS